MINNSSFLITGGTGSFGQEFLKYLLEIKKIKKRIIIFSRDELKQFEMKKRFNPSQYPNLRYFIGDIRDKNRLDRALSGIDIIVHAAALKQVDVGEYNPTEFISTNIMGAQNIIEASISNKIKKIIALSTDKAAAPINLYGATKLTSDKLFIAANNIKGKRDIKFSVVRYGNVMGSNGSVMPFFMKIRETGTIPITHKDMTRFNISLEDGCEMVFDALDIMWGGELFVPKIPSYKILDVAKAIAPDCKHKIVGIRPGEKLHEEMITISDAMNTYDIGKYYTILPTQPIFDIHKFISNFEAKKVNEGFSYNSGSNSNWETIASLRKLIKIHVDRNFRL